ncbi:MAG TPA: glycosyl hydrolase family 28-related protein [Armatimonadota bacterium]|nr:glycosyl hydrolase family 28-related protein [Armatimonadota bacterium]
MNDSSVLTVRTLLFILAAVTISSIPGAAAPLPAPTFLDIHGETVVASAVATDPRWGADPTGRADSSGAIQRALDDVAAAGGGVVFLPAGRFRLDGPLRIGYATTLRGAGGDPDRLPAAQRTVLLATGAPFDRPLLDVTAGEGALVGLAIWYPQQSAEDVVAYPFSILASAADLRDVALLDSFNGVEIQAANTCFVDHLVGTVLNRGLSAQHSTEFSWMRDVHFANRFWRQAAVELGGPALSPDAAASLDRFTRLHLVGLELGRIDGMAVDGFRADDARVAVRIEKDPHENQHRVFGFGGVVRDVHGPREEFGWDPWYYGMHYVDVDRVPELVSRGTLRQRPPVVPVPAPARRDPGSFIDVTRPVASGKPGARFGAVGDVSAGLPDGTSGKPEKADDTAAIQGALDAEGRAGGGTVYLPQGQYRITRPLTVPRGVELRGPLGRGKSRAFRPTCVLEAFFGAGAPETDPALVTLQDHAGIRGLEIAYPDQPFDAARLQSYPYAIRGAGAGVWIVDVLLVNAYSGIDLASHRCDHHVVEGVWGTAMRNGIRVGGGSRGGYLERLAFSYGPWAESWLLSAADRARTEGIAADHRLHTVQYIFGDCSGEQAWGLVGFNPFIHCRFQDDGGGGCTSSTFWLSLFDVPYRTLLEMDGGSGIRFIGLWGTGGGGDRVSNWVEVGPKFRGPLEVDGKAIQPTFLNHPMRFRPGQIVIHDEASLADGRPAAASAAAPGHGPALALDRDPRTFWQAPAGSWLQVDLRRVRMVDRFGIESAGLFLDRGLNTLEADLYLSVDGRKFVRAARLETNGAAWADRPVEPTEARYARLVVTRPGADGIIRVTSFEVYGR